MTNEDRNKQNQVQQHSLPGTNQAGKGPDSSKKGDHEHRPGAEIGSASDQLEKHSLPGTNQAGKGADSSRKNDRDNKPAD
jgi:hypothetical protein